MTHIFIKRVYEPAVSADGCRVLVDKLWPRGIRKQALQYDLWAKEITPSDELRRWYHADPAERWTGFRHKYTEELRHSKAVQDFLHNIAHEPTITLLYASKNAAENHALVLQAFMEETLACITVSGYS